MKFLQSVSIIFIFFYFFSIFTPVLASNNCSITTLLQLGSKNYEVVCLQSTLGLTADGKFGPKTRAAVIAWQYSKGLVADGIFGSKSRTVWNKIPLITAIVPSTIPSNSNNTLSNMTNLDKFIDTVVDVNKKQGKSEQELQLIATTLRNQIASSGIDYNKEFEKTLLKDANAAISSAKPSIFSKISSFLGISPSIAHAGVGLPFGGSLLFSFFCASSGNWMITISPLAPNYVTLLSYFPGTQGFAGYNLPFTRNLLGMYEPVGVCVITPVPPVVITTQGTITPMTGSSSF